jgi:hypothetical protein
VFERDEGIWEAVELCGREWELVFEVEGEKHLRSLL